MQSSGGGSLNAQQIGQEQSGMNAQTAITQAALNNTNQVTPYGNLTYSQTGGQTINGNWVPSYTATQTLSPEQQKIYQSQTGLQQQALDLAPGVLNNVQNAVNTPLTDNTDLRNQAYDALTSRSTQDLTRQIDLQKTQLANQGIQPGTEAYNAALLPFTRGITDASNQATIGAGNIAQQNLGMEQTIRNQPLQDYSTLLGFGGGVTSPNFVNTPQTQVQPTDVTSPAIAQYQQQNATNNSALGGLFGLGGSLLGAGILKYSDRRLKTNIQRIGTAANGLPIYTYEIGGDPEIGVMADEVLAVRPDAVHVDSDGYLLVDYAKALDTVEGTRADQSAHLGHAGIFPVLSAVTLSRPEGRHGLFGGAADGIPGGLRAGPEGQEKGDNYGFHAREVVRQPVDFHG